MYTYLIDEWVTINIVNVAPVIIGVNHRQQKRNHDNIGKPIICSILSQNRSASV